MPNVVNRANGKPTGGGAKEQAGAKNASTAKSAEPGLFDKVKQMPPRLLIGGGVALGVALLACLWFLFGVGPEDSGKAAESASAAPAPARPAAASAEAGGATAGSQVTSTAAPGSPAAAPNAAPAASPGYANNSPAGMPVNNSPAAVPGGGGTPPQEVEGLPPITGGAGKGTTWHPTDAPGAVISHGPASDP